MKIKILILNFIVNLLQMIMLVLMYQFFYQIALFFHKPNSITPHNFYGLTLILLTYFIVLSIPVLTIIETLLNNLKKQTFVNWLWILLIIILTFDEITYQPYDFGLIIFCITFSVILKQYLRKKLKLLNTCYM